jgi:hypothetical protein
MVSSCFVVDPVASQVRGVTGGRVHNAKNEWQRFQSGRGSFVFYRWGYHAVFGWWQLASIRPFAVSTFSKEKDVQAMEKIAREEKLDDLFNNEDLGKIASAVSQMFG